MCVYSVMIDQWKPYMPWFHPTNPPQPYTVPQFLPAAPAPSVTPELAALMREILEKVDKIDKALGLRDCTNELHQKQAFIAKLDELISSERATPA